MRPTMTLLCVLTSAGAMAANSLAADAGGPLPGQVVVDPEYPQSLIRRGGGHLFICGPGDPEDFLYVGKRNSDGTRDGDQLSRIRKLVEHGGNCLYMQIVRTHGGDAKPDATHNPFVDSDPSKGLDEDILAQWHEWFSLADRHNILLYLFFYDDGARIWNTGDQVGPEERAFFEEIVRRFKGYKNLIWVVGEESEERYSDVRVRALARIIRNTDDHAHMIGNHHLPGTTFKAWRPGSALNHFSMQLTEAGERAHAGAIESLRKAAGRYQVIYSESIAAPTDVDGVRKYAWAVAMGGVMPMIYPMSIVDTPIETLHQCRFLQTFFESTDFYTLQPHDELKAGETEYVLADPGRSYIAYSTRAHTGLVLKDVPAGDYSVTWLDCQTGKAGSGSQRLAQGGTTSFARPATIGAECATWIRRPGAAGRRQRQLAGGGVPDSITGRNKPPQVNDQTVSSSAGKAVYIQLGVDDEDGPGPYSFTIVQGPSHGTLTGEDNDRMYTPAANFSGDDRITWKVTDGKSESKVATVTIHVGQHEQ